MSAWGGAPRHAVVVDRTGGKSWRTRVGTGLLPPQEWDLTVVTDRRPSGATPPGVRLIEIGDLTDGGIRQAVTAIAASRPIDRMSTVSEFFLTTIAALREELRIPGKTLDYTRRFRDKWLMKQRAQDLSIPCAVGVRASEVDNWPVARRAQHGYVVKPRLESGARGVSVVPGWDQVVDLVADLPDPAGHLVEEFDPSPLLHVDGVVVGSRVVLQVSRYVRPCHSSGGAVPLSSYTVDDAALVARVSEFMDRVIAGWPLYDDTFHCELFDAPGRLSLCEIAARPGGAGVPEVFRATRGIDLRHAKTLLDLGLDPLPLAASTPIAAHGGWTVVYASAAGPARVDDSAVAGHRTREVYPSGPPVLDIAGVGIATYTFTADHSDQVVRLIDRYEKGVRVTPEPGATGPPAGAVHPGPDKAGGGE